MTERLRLNFGDTRIECLVTSSTESARVRKVTEYWTAQWASFLPQGAVFFDVGANIGIMSLLACENASKLVRAVAFEPAVTNFAALAQNIQLNALADRIAPIPAGLGAATALSALKYQNIDAGGSLHSFENIIAFKPSRSTEPVMSLPTLCYALDDFVTIDGVPFPTHLKIDVDGTELSVLKGSRKTLRDPRLREVQVEVVDFTSAEATSRAVIELMAAVDMCRFDVFPHNAAYPRARDLRFYR